ncbi:MAG: hypothetical protein ABSB34_10105 [Candidatus Limnocylindrales bacterium]
MTGTAAGTAADAAVSAVAVVTLSGVALAGVALAGVALASARLISCTFLGSIGPFVHLAGSWLEVRGAAKWCGVVAWSWQPGGVVSGGRATRTAQGRWKGDRLDVLASADRPTSRLPPAFRPLLPG